MNRKIYSLCVSYRMPDHTGYSRQIRKIVASTVDGAIEQVYNNLKHKKAEIRTISFVCVEFE